MKICLSFNKVCSDYSDEKCKECFESNAGICDWCSKYTRIRKFIGLSMVCQDCIDILNEKEYEE